MRHFRKKLPQKKYYITNYRITAQTLRVVDETSKQIGMLPRDEAIRIAQQEEKDLVLIAPAANPPVAKIIELSKFLYQEEKKLKESKKAAKKSLVKDVSLSLFIGPADLERLINKGKLFLEEGHQVRLNLLLRGREIMKRDMGFDLVKRAIRSLGEVNVSKEPRLEGRVIRAVVSRKK